MPITAGIAGGAGMGNRIHAKIKPTTKPVPIDANDCNKNVFIMQGSPFTRTLKTLA
jgi:hypothetical protein